MEVFVKCYKLRATKCTFVEHSSGIISPEILENITNLGLQNVPLLNTLLKLSPW
jgi:hypothetical protein